MTDNRRQNAALNQGRRAKKETSKRFLLVMLSYMLMGGFMTMYISFMDSIILAASVLNTIAMVMFMMTLITDYSSILLDTTDNVILLPRPIDGRTLFAARLTHITIYIAQIVLAFSIIPFIVLTFKFHIAVAFWFFISLIFNALFSAFLTSMIYLLLMRFANEERIKDILNYIQMGMAISIFAFYQLMPRLFKIQDISDTSFEPAAWHLFIPSIWLGGFVETLSTFQFSGFNTTLTIVAVTFPLLGLWLMNRLFSTIFTQKLSAFNTESKASEAKHPPSVFSSKNTIPKSLSQWFTSNTIEKSVFQLVWLQLIRDRKIRLRIYPQYAYVLVMMVVFFWRFFDSEEGIEGILEAIKESRGFLFLIYFGSTVLSASITSVPYSDDYKAAWVYYAFPISNPGNILIGSLKAQFFQIFMPFYLFLSVIIVIVWGGSIADDLIFGLFNIIIVALVSSLMMRPLLPFSEQGNAQEQSGNFMKALLSFFTFGGLALIHYFITKLPYALIILMPFQILAIYFLIKEYRNTTWEKVNIASI